MDQQVDESRYEFVAVAPERTLVEGRRLFIEIDDRPLVILKVAGRLYAIADLCTHDGGPVGEGELEGFEIVCPRHGARFDVRTGKAISLPAVEDIPACPVRVKEGMIEIGIPKEE